MSVAEAPADTEAQQILAGQARIEEALTAHADAINGLGKNVQWLVDNVQGIFQMFSNPAMIQQMMGGLMGGNGNGDGPEE